MRKAISFFFVAYAVICSAHLAFAEAPKSKFGARPIHEQKTTKKHSDESRPSPLAKEASLPRKDNASYDSTIQRAGRSWTDSGGAWNTNYLKSAEGKRTREALEAYDRGEVGKSVREFDLTNLTAAQIREAAKEKGFEERTEKLVIDRDEDNKPVYVKKGPPGQNSTKDESDADIVQHVFYTHKDKGLIRVKPDGTPGSQLRPEPHAVKAVLYKDAEDDSFASEAFKVTNRDVPVPKRPDAGEPVISDGLKRGDSEKVRDRMDALADLAHTNLKLTK